MQLIYLVGFNNYFNRKIIYYTDVSDYTGNSSFNFPQSSIDFNPNDGVTTEQIVNWVGGNETPDYVLVVNESDESIVSRWFVTEWVRTRGGQYKATLRRDVIADHYNRLDIVRLFAERGPIIDNKSSLIYNNEGLSLNQIKTSQTALKDDSLSPWIVGYLARDYSAEGAEGKLIQSISDEVLDAPDLTALGIQLNDLADPTKGGIISCIAEDEHNEQILGAGMEYNFQTTTFLPYDFRYVQYNTYSILSPSIHSSRYSYIGTSNFEGARRFQMSKTDYSINTVSDEIDIIWKEINNSYPGLYGILKDDLLRIHPEYTSYTNYSKVLGTEGVVVKYDNKYYRISVIRETVTESKMETVTSTRMTSSFYAIASMANDAVAELIRRYSSGYVADRIKGNPLNITYNEFKSTLQIVETVGPGTIKTHIRNSRRHCVDAPYDIFCMKYTPDNLALAQVMGQELTGFIYDIQILPYCPARYIKGWTELEEGVTIPIILGLTEHNEYEKILDEDDQLVDYMFWCTNSSGTFNIQEKVVIPEREGDEALNKKLSNECDLYRLSGPNMASSFEFSVAKNNDVDYFRVSFTYKPYQPYVRVTPNFKGLYGSDYKDSRGLILQGDFSIDVITDQWKQYQIQNKNYENIFNTQIKSMDAIADIQERQRWIGVGTSAAKGAVKGMITGNVAGAVSGAGIGLVSGVSGAIAENQMYDIQRQEKIDLYNYQLGNVKALPDTLTKVTAYNIDNNYFPVIEYYTCSEEEVEIVKKKIEFENYKLMETTTLGELMSRFNKGQGLNFVKGIVIYNPVEDDEHMLSEMYNEFNKGVYL